MYERQPDPFFEQLKADIAEGVAAADRGELIDEDEVWRELGERIQKIRSDRQGPPLD